jgi:hypothetical protein
MYTLPLKFIPVNSLDIIMLEQLLEYNELNYGYIEEYLKTNTLPNDKIELLTTFLANNILVKSAEFK